MEHLKSSFERELKNKLAEKTRGAQSEEAVLMKSFKYFDLNDNGTVEPEEFAKAIEKIGIQIPTRADLDMLFSLYDADGSGALDYKEFTSGMWGKPVVAAKSSNDPEQLALALQKKLGSRGARGVIGLQRQFRIMDDDGSKTLNQYEFNKAMNDFQLNFNQGEISILFRFFDVSGDGQISYDEFLRAVRGQMNPNRKRCVAQAFKKLDKDGNGWIDINDIRGVYNAQKHPDVTSGKKTEEQVLQEFLETFETHHAMRTNDAPNYVVTKEEFEEYYNNISCSIDDDMYFQLMISNAWKLTEESRAGGNQKGWSADHTNKARKNTSSNIFNRPEPKAQEAAPKMTATDEVSVKEHIRSKMAKRGPRGIASLGKKFKIADDDRSGELNMEEFSKAMHDFRMELSPEQVQMAWDFFDRDGSGSISYDEFLRSVVGRMNASRVAVAKKAFSIMDKDGSGVLDLNDIRTNYNAKQHPDVQAGKKTEDEILLEFLDTFEDHFCDMKGHADSRDGKITVDEWLEYYNNVSMSIDRDDYFQLMMNNTWNLDGSRVTKKGWSGEY